MCLMKHPIWDPCPVTGDTIDGSSDELGLLFEFGDFDYVLLRE